MTKKSDNQFKIKNEAFNIERMSDKEKALLIMEESQKAFNKFEKQFKKLSEAMLDLRRTFEDAKIMLKRVSNEEINQCNIHKDCDYYNCEKDFCSNYLLGKYTALAFEVSRHNQCIKDMTKCDKNE